MCWDYRHKPQLVYARASCILSKHSVNWATPPAPITALLLGVTGVTTPVRRPTTGEDGALHSRPHCGAGIRTGVPALDSTCQVVAVGPAAVFCSDALVPTPAPCPGCLGAAVQFLSMWGKRHASLGCPGVGVLRIGQDRKG